MNTDSCWNGFRDSDEILIVATPPNAEMPFKKIEICDGAVIVVTLGVLG